MKPIQPVFFGIGAQVPGIAEVYAYVREHPGVSVPKEETHFFSSDRLNKGREWYEDHFTDCDESCAVGELATTYLHTPGSAPRIARDYPRSTLFAVVRNPITSIELLYGQAVAYQKNPLPLEAYLEKNPQLLEQFRFGRHLAHYFSYYSPVDLQVITYEEYLENPLKVMTALYEHLEIDKNFIPKDLRIDAEPRFPRLLRLAKRLGIIKIINYVHAWRKARRERRRAIEKPLLKITKRDRLLLTKYYEKDIEQLSALLHRNMMAEWDLLLPEPAVASSGRKKK